MNWNEIYQKNQRLEELYAMKYFDQEPNYFEKNCLGLVVEIAEAANESKCFKYWSVKPVQKEKILEELADCFILTFYFFQYLGLEIELLPVGSESNDLVTLFQQLLQLSTCLVNDCDSQIVKKIFVCLLQVGSLMGITELELQEACLKKQEKDEMRLRSNCY